MFRIKPEIELTVLGYNKFFNVFFFFDKVKI